LSESAKVTLATSVVDPDKILRFPDSGPEPESKNCEKPDPISSDISDLLLFVSYFASQNKEIKFGSYFFDVCCAH